MKNGITVEICAGSLEDALKASQFFAVDRIELNSALELGGLTPSLSSLKLAKRNSYCQIIAMCRPRAAGFIYSLNEKQVMKSDAQLFLENGADGIVFGSLNEDHTVDELFTADMVNMIQSFGKTAVFHKAFDDTRDLCEACEKLIQLGVDRILTSGGKPDVSAGKEMIRLLTERYGRDIEILPGGGVSEENVYDILKYTGAKQIHMSAKSIIEQDGTYPAVDPKRIEAILKQI